MNIKNYNDTPQEVWIGLVGVKSLPGSKFLSKEAKGAYINILAPANCIAEFRAAVERALNHYRLRLIEIENAEPLSARLSKAVIDESLLTLAEEVKITGKIRFGSVHEYENDEDIE